MPDALPPTPAERDASSQRTWRILTGRLSAWSDLVASLTEWHGLNVLVADPWSGTTDLLEEAKRTLDRGVLLVDVRSCRDALDMAMAITDGAVQHFEPKAWPSWTDDRALSPAAHRAFRTIGLAGLPVEDLQMGGGRPEAALRAALEVVAVLAGEDSHPILVLDHLGRMLSGLRESDARTTLEVIRSTRQAHSELGLMLVDYAGGPIAEAMSDEKHPLYLAGRIVRVRRAQPRAVPQDLAVTRPNVMVNAAVLAEAAVLAHGIPTLTWAIVDRAYGLESADPAAQAQHGWQVVRRDAAPWLARQWDSLRHVHRAAQPAIAAMARGVAPTSIDLANKSVSDALLRLQAAGVTWQPAPREWAIVDPTLAAWAADHAPPWALRH